MGARCENVAKLALANDDDVVKTFPARAATEMNREVSPTRQFGFAPRNTDNIPARIEK
jgi:hypothetical protein